MLQKNKSLILIIIILLVTITLVYLFNINKEPTNQGQGQNIVPPENGTKLSFREERLKRFYENPDDSLLLKVDGKEFRVISYQSGNPNGRPYNHQDVPKFRGGVTILEKKNGKWEIFWESFEAIDNPDPYVELKDLTNDRTEEIIVTLLQSRNIAYYIYQWRDGTFKTISPLQETTSGIGTFKETTLGGYPAIIKDIDNDNIYEVITEYEINTNPDISPPKYEYYRQIYKYDGEKYYLFKEEKIGEEKPENIEP